MQKRFGTDIIVLRETESKDIDLQHLEELLSQRSASDTALTLVSITHVPTSSGRVYDAAGIGSVVQRHPGASAFGIAAHSLARRRGPLQQSGACLRKWMRLALLQGLFSPLGKHGVE